MTTLINPYEFSPLVQSLRTFFLGKGFLEVHTQNRLSILAACEDPTTVATYDYAGQVWPLPQTGQMWLEYELLKRPELNGVFCVSTSYRQEPNPVPGRHDLIFPMFEFEAPGDLEDLKDMEMELVEYLGLANDYVPDVSYKEACEYYKVDILEAEHEEEMWKDFGPVVLLSDFPNYTSPFWNMKKAYNEEEDLEYAKKVDVIIAGMETIGSAERSTNAEEMRDEFHTISDGLYADLLYSHFGKERVEKELEEFLSFDFFSRYGGGIGITRLIRALKELK